MMIKEIPFTKISATGNDFILFDMIANASADQILQQAFFRAICKRRTGAGADGILLIEKSKIADFKMRYLNADGREVEMCGNGARAAAFYAFHAGHAPVQSKFDVQGVVYEALVEGKAVSLFMHPPEEMALKPGILEHDDIEEGGVARVGVPHYVLLTKSIFDTDVAKLGRFYCHHERFKPAQTNVNFVEINVHNELEIRTWERGVEAETLACGTGAVASAFIASKLHGISFPITLRAAGGTLTVAIDKHKERPLLHGEVKIPYSGKLRLDAFATELAVA